jgi:hypothetical protein
VSKADSPRDVVRFPCPHMVQGFMGISSRFGVGVAASSELTAAAMRLISSGCDAALSYLTRVWATPDGVANTPTFEHAASRENHPTIGIISPNNSPFPFASHMLS